jgi:hypothetical protein
MKGFKELQKNAISLEEMKGVKGGWGISLNTYCLINDLILSNSLDVEELRLAMNTARTVCS